MMHRGTVIAVLCDRLYVCRLTHTLSALKLLN